MNWEGCERKRAWHEEAPCLHLPEGSDQNHKKLNEYSQFLRSDYISTNISFEMALELRDSDGRMALSWHTKAQNTDCTKALRWNDTETDSGRRSKSSGGS